jgi:hypothetical protein
LHPHTSVEIFLWHHGQLEISRAKVIAFQPELDRTVSDSYQYHVGSPTAKEDPLHWLRPLLIENVRPFVPSRELVRFGVGSFSVVL